ncbi:MAG TPA: TonB-dependent receptor, partial [Acidobacteriaceae bacterium]
MGNRRYILGAAVTCVLLLSPSAWCQNTNTGEIKGSVTDPSGAVLPNATVTLTNVLTGVATVAHSNNSGLYDEPSLPVGRYSARFSLPGFHDFVRENIDLQVGILGVDAKLEVGASNEQVTVTAEAPQVETESSEQSVNFDAKTVQDVPTVGGVWYNEITEALPGVNAGGGGSQSASGQGVGVNGTQGYLGTWLLEGSTATEPRDQNASNNYPPIDAIGEVNVQISNYGAQYGAGVAQFNVILKSGTNKFHGSLFEFIQNDAFNARNYFQGSATSAPLRWNEFGGSIGGPILHDKLFFFFTYQRNPEHSTAIEITTVPTQAMRNGDFSAFNATVYDPSTTHCTGSAVSTCTRTAFQYNTLPTGSIDPVAAQIQSYLPLPNQPGLFNNYKVPVTTPGLSQWYIGKIEYDLSPRHRLTGSIFEFPTTLVNSVSAFCAQGLDCTYTSPRNLNQHAEISELWTISSTTLNEAHLGGVRESDVYVPPTYGKGVPAKLGLQPAYGANAPGDIFPNITINNGGGAGAIGFGGGTHAKLADGTYDFSDVLTLVRGRHTLKLGGEYDRSYQNYTNWADVSSGNFQFSGLATENPSGVDPLTGTASQGVPYADFLLGQVYGWYLYDYAETGARTWDMGGFFQDDLKLLPNLTLNLGVRYTWQAGWSEVKNRWGTFDPKAVNTGQYVTTGTLGAIVYGGQNGRGTIQNGVSEVAPRVGLSYAPRPGLAIRASYGIFDAPRSAETYTDNALGLGLNPRGSAGYGSFPAFQLKNGPPAGAVVYPSLSNLSNSQFNYQAVDYYPRQMPIQYYQEALLSVQKDLPYNVLFDTSYVFTKGTHLNFGRDINQVPQNQLATGYNAMPYTQYTSILGHLFDGYSNYNALQLRVDKRPAHGISF